jgi:hypothetical protein
MKGEMVQVEAARRLFVEEELVEPQLFLVLGKSQNS